MNNAIVCPTYLNKQNLPYAADIFYHGGITYFLPTGFHPLELQSVIEFPEYCRYHSIAFPNIIWKMCQLYFENTFEAKECIDILEPLRKDYIIIATPVYDRDFRAINETKQFIQKYTQLLDIFSNTELNLKFASRELMSHVLHESILGKSCAGSVEYLHENCKRVNDLIQLIAAVIINRIRHFTVFTENILLYEHEWYPLIIEVDKSQKIEKGEYWQSKNEVITDIEIFRFRLFEQILNPIFGKCDAVSKNEKVVKIIKNKTGEINLLKNKCEVIAREILLMPTDEIQLKQRRLSEMIENEITVPLGDLMDYPGKQIRQLLTDFISDSTVIAGILTFIEGPNLTTFTTAITAGAISTSVKYIINNTKRKTIASELLVAGMKHMKIKYEEVQQYLNEIIIEQFDIKAK